MVLESVAAAFLAGLASFLSPCFLPLVPAMLAYLTSPTACASGGTKAGFSQKNTLFFIAGFVLIFSVIGVALNTVLSSAAPDARLFLSRAGGIIVFLMGLSLLGVLRFDFLPKIKLLGIAMPQNPSEAPFIAGCAFAAGAGGCMGAILGGIALLSTVSSASAFLLFFTYSLGLASPIFLLSFLSERLASRICRILSGNLYEKLVGALLALFGIAVFLGLFG